ncbi:MAG: hypothetical protein GYA21_18800 [Myxococcales bacterium]|nr:hypothetical protein [Myxococcales bacterium]
MKKPDGNPAPAPAPPSGWQIVEDLLRRRLIWTARSLAEPAPRSSFGLEALDKASGGLLRGGLTEVIVPGGGSATIAYAALRASTSRGEMNALIDPGDGFDPEAAAAAGVDLARLLWLRPPDRAATLRGTEIVLETGGFGLVILDLVGCRSDQLPSRSAWPRLARRAREGRTALLALASHAQARHCASLSLRVTRARFRWRGSGRLYWDGVELEVELLRRAPKIS